LFHKLLDNKVDTNWLLSYLYSKRQACSRAWHGCQ